MAAGNEAQAVLRAHFGLAAEMNLHVCALGTSHDDTRRFERCAPGAFAGNEAA